LAHQLARTKVVIRLFQNCLHTSPGDLFLQEKTGPKWTRLLLNTDIFVT
jgi:hypothetical protein